MPDIYLQTQGARYHYYDQQGCLQGTRGTVLESLESWTRDFSGPPIIWLNGLFGTGKSVIAQTVVEWCDAQDQLVLSFFCSHNIYIHNNPHLVFPFLAIQLAQKCPEVRSTVVSLLRFNPKTAYESPFDQVEKLIVGPLKLMGIPTVIVIDGLDGWADDTLQSSIISAVEHWAQEIPKVKFLMTSQPKPHILASFHLSLLNGLANTITLHAIEPDLIDNDIRLFLKHELSELATWNKLDKWPTATQLDLLCDRAAGLFVYAVATAKFLGYRHALPNEQYTIIANSPEDTIHEGKVEGVHAGLSLDSLCLSILQKSFRNNKYEDDVIVCPVLAVVVLATYPLPPSAIATLIGLEVGEVMSVLRSIQPLLRLHEDPDQPVHPFHKLFSDLLTSPTRCVDKRFYISPGKFHSKIALGCFELMNKTFKGRLLSQDHTMDSEAAFQYACTSWHIHLTEAREDIATLVTAFSKFLEEDVGPWSETTTVTVSTQDEIVSWLCEVCFGLL